MEELKKCPCCGTEPKIYKRCGSDFSSRYIQCPKCGISTHVRPLRYAIKQWNNRENLGLR